LTTAALDRLVSQSPRFEAGRSAAGVAVFGEDIAPQRLAHVSLWIRSGTRLEGPGSYGATHALEHLAIRRLPEFTWPGLVERAGGSYNAVTDREFLAFFYSAPAEFAAGCLPDFLDQLPIATRSFAPDEFESEKSVLAEEWRHLGTDPTGYLLAGLHELVLPGQLRHYPGGTEADLDELSAPVVAAVADRIWTRPQLALIVSGLPMEVAIEALDNSALSRLSDAPAATGQLDDQRVRGSFQFDDPAGLDPDTAVLQGLGALGPGCVDDTLAATEVAISVLAGGSSSRLFQVVRGEHGLAYGVDGWHIAYADAGLSTVLVQTSAEHTTTVERLIDTEIHRLIDEPVGREELETAQRRLVGQRFQLWEDGVERVFAAGRAQFVPAGRTTDLTSWARACFEVQPADVALAARKLLDRQVVCHV